MRRIRLAVPIVVTGLVATGVSPVSAATRFPGTIPLPNGFRPEGIAIGNGPHAYLGSLADGDIYRADLRTGKGSVISQGPGTPTVGLKVDRSGRIFAAGGSGGDARVIDSRTGRILRSYKLATGTTFVNDVVLTGDAAWFTDSGTPQPALYRLRLGRHGELPARAERLPLKGDLVYDPSGPNANGIVQTPDRRALLIVQTTTGKIFRVDPRTGVTRTVNLNGASVPRGDGMLLRGDTLYVVQNFVNAVAVLKVNRSGTSARLVRRVTDPRFAIPTTVAAFRDRLYLPNARFDITPTPTTPYNFVAIPAHRR